MRTASARNMAMAALVNESPEWKAASISEIKFALQTDETDAGLLQLMIFIDLSLSDIAQAQHYYDQLKRVDAKSPLIELVKQSHQRQPSAVAAEP